MKLIIIISTNVIFICVVVFVMGMTGALGNNHGNLIHTGFIKSYSVSTSQLWSGEATIVFTDNFTVTSTVPLIQDNMQAPRDVPNYRFEYDLFDGDLDRSGKDKSGYYLLRPHGCPLNVPKVE